MTNDKGINVISQKVRANELIVFPSEKGEPAAAWEYLGSDRRGNVRIRRSADAGEAKRMVADATRDGKRLTWMER